MRKIFYLLLVMSFSLSQDIPFIDSIEPAFGEIGSTIMINGGNFNPNDAASQLFVQLPRWFLLVVQVGDCRKATFSSMLQLIGWQPHGSTGGGGHPVFDSREPR